MAANAGDVREARTTRRFFMRLFMVCLIVGLVSSVVLYREALMAGLSDVLSPRVEDPVPVRVLQERPFQLEAPAFGEIVGMETVPVPTPRTPVSSLKVAWLIPEGSVVEAGDTVVLFDKTDAQLALEVQENALAANEEREKVTTTQQETDQTVLNLDRSDAEIEYEFAMTVLPQDETIFAKWDIIEAQINADFAKDRIDFLNHKGRTQRRVARADQQILAIERNKAQTEMQMAKRTLDALELRTPASGLALYRLDRRREPQVGDDAMPGQVLVEIIDLATFQARIYVLERDAGGLSRGKSVNLRLDAIPGRDFVGTITGVSAVSQSLERNSPLKYFTCEVAMTGVGEAATRIKPGMTVRAEVILERFDSCFVIPVSAVTMKETEATIYVQNGETFDPRIVQVGTRSHGLYPILSGVQDGEVVALRNPFESRKSYLPDF
ncbi:MAG: HlyD family efflux transporter periplasmic adaptor subunit, partial [Acidobacteriota bacterium]